MDFSIRPIEGPEVLFFFDNIFCLDSLLFVLLHVVWLWTRRETFNSASLCVQTPHCVGVKWKKTRNLLQKISKCDKEIQLIRIRCRHMRLQLRFFLSPAILPTSAGSGMKQKTIKTKSHAVQLEEIRLDWSSEKRANWKPKVSRRTSAARKSWLCWLKLHKKFHERVFGAIRWSSENRKKLEVFFFIFGFQHLFFSLCFWGHNY